MAAVEKRSQEDSGRKNNPANLPARSKPKPRLLDRVRYFGTRIACETAAKNFEQLSSGAGLILSMIKSSKKLKSNGVKTETFKLEPAKSVPPAPEVRRVSLELTTPGAKKVCVAGSFNGWTPEKTPLEPAGNGRWVGDLTVDPGKYEYLFVVDGQWLPDPNAKESVQNPFGGKNSVLVVST